MLDKESIQSFENTGVQAIFISFVQGGCSGTKVSIETEFDTTGLVNSPLNENITAFYKKEEQEVLEQGNITCVNGKWIFASKEIQNRCGCGESFSFQKKIIDTNKLAKLKEVFKKTLIK